MLVCTICLISSYPFYILTYTYYLRYKTTSWTDITYKYCVVQDMQLCEGRNYGEKLFYPSDFAIKVMMLSEQIVSLETFQSINDFLDTQ